MRSESRKGVRGFTLVELLVVIGIIAVLIAILMPLIARAQERGRAVKCLSNLRQLGAAVTMYANAHRGRLPSALYWVVWMGNQKLDPEEGELAPYVGLPFNAQHYRCPSDFDERSSAFKTPYTYAANARMFYNSFQANLGYCPPITGIINSAEKIMMVDYRTDQYFVPQFWYIEPSYAMLSSRHISNAPADKFIPAMGGTWHLSYGGNVLFVDGHAAFYSDGRSRPDNDIHPDFGRRNDPYTQ